MGRYTTDIDQSEKLGDMRKNGSLYMLTVAPAIGSSIALGAINPFLIPIAVVFLLPLIWSLTRNPVVSVSTRSRVFPEIEALDEITMSLNAILPKDSEVLRTIRKLNYRAFVNAANAEKHPTGPTAQKSIEYVRAALVQAKEIAAAISAENPGLCEEDVRALEQAKSIAQSAKEVGSVLRELER